MKCIWLLLPLFVCTQLSGQLSEQNTGISFTIDTTSTSAFNLSKRKKVFVISTVTGYSAMATGLYFAWYDNYDQREFHLFNDWNEWENMDKAGHIYSAYMQSQLIYELASWSGYDDDKALLWASLCSFTGQLNIEIMDGFSTGWGFSLSDLGANILGTTGFYLQQKTWGEQRLRMKMSYWPISYDQTPLYSESGLHQYNLHDRSKALYGHHSLERFIKDYNGQTIWVSANIHSFFKQSKWPSWLNLALGYSGHNMYGGFSNQWQLNEETIVVDPNLFPRSGQWVLALDYDLTKIKTNKPLAKSALKILNIFKWPAPGLSYDRDRGVVFHLIYKN